MKIGVQTWGSEGDLRPLFALAHGLRRAGHEVRVIFTSVDGRDYGELGRLLGLDTKAVANEYLRANSRSLRDATAALYRLRDPFRQVRLVLDAMYRPLREELLVAWADVVVGHHLVDTLAVAAELASVPYVSVALAGGLRTGAVPPGGVPDLGPWLNRAAWSFGSWAMNLYFRGELNRFRTRHGARPVGDVLTEGLASPRLNLIANSPTLYPPQREWPDQHKVCGFMEVPAPADAEAPNEAVERFLGAGEPPVYFTFGSILTVEQPVEWIEESVAAMVDAAVRSRVRAIVQAPWSKLEGRLVSRSTPEHVLRLERIEHSRVFGRCALVVHHAGAGTTQAALRAGRPSVVVPHAIDQHYWAGLLHRRGLAPKPLNRRALSGARLSARIREALARPDMAALAEQVGEAMMREDGVREAVGHIERLMRAHRTAL